MNQPITRRPGAAPGGAAGNQKTIFSLFLSRKIILTLYVNILVTLYLFLFSNETVSHQIF